MSKGRVSLLIPAILVAACGGGDDDNVDAGPSATCIEATMHSDYDFIQDRILNVSCSGFNSCHKGAALEAGGLSLERGETIRQTVNVDSDLFPQFKRILPGDPANSYLFIIIGGAPGPIDPEVDFMPLNNPRLCQEKIDAIGRWIEAGAMETAPTVDAGVD